MMIKDQHLGDVVRLAVFLAFVVVIMLAGLWVLASMGHGG